MLLDTLNLHLIAMQNICETVLEEEGTMQMRKVMVGMAFAGVLTNTAPASAQAPLFDVAAVQAGCASGAGVCLVAVQAAIAALAGLPAATLNTQLGVIAGIATEAAQSAPPAQQAAYAGVLNEVAAASSDPDQIESLTEVAGSFATGGTVDTEATAESGSTN